jgi:ABC-2 type transport system ATP-binding protein
VLLTTQYLEEADQLADDIAVIDGGKVIAEGTSDQLKAQIGGHRVVVALVDADDSDAARTALARFGSGEPTVSADGRSVEVAVTDGPRALQSILAELGAAGVALHDAGMRRPTLDDVFLKLTGRKAAVDTETDDADTASASKSAKNSAKKVSK